MLVAVWFGFCPESDGDQLLLAGGELLYGYGAMQRRMEPSWDQTLGDLREEWDDPSVGAGWPAATPCFHTHVCGADIVFIDITLS